MYRVDEKRCIKCHACESVCLENCISDGTNLTKKIDERRCSGCEACLLICPVKCIHLAFN